MARIIRQVKKYYLILEILINYLNIMYYIFNEKLRYEVCLKNIRLSKKIENNFQIQLYGKIQIFQDIDQFYWSCVASSLNYLNL